jgi:hypothetical protein
MSKAQASPSKPERRFHLPPLVAQATTPDYTANPHVPVSAMIFEMVTVSQARTTDRIIHTMAKVRQSRRRFGRIFLFFTALVVVALCAWGLWRYHGPAPEREIFRGITYGCEQMPDTAEIGGLLHWIRADLNVPGVSLYTTPMDPQTQAKGFEYKLQHTSTLVNQQGLAAAVNGTLFSSDSGMIRLPGDIALSCETVVSNHVINHIDPNSYLLWCDDQNNLHMELNKPPSLPVLSKARWAIGGQEVILFPGRFSDEAFPDSRTAIGIDPVKKSVWIACFDKASNHAAAKALARLGAIYAIMVDGGTSVAMVIGSGAKHVRPGTVTGNWRPVATHFGFRADPLP